MTSPTEGLLWRWTSTRCPAPRRTSQTFTQPPNAQPGADSTGVPLCVRRRTPSSRRPSTDPEQSSTVDGPRAVVDRRRTPSSRRPSTDPEQSSTVDGPRAVVDRRRNADLPSRRRSRTADDTQQIQLRINELLPANLSTTITRLRQTALASGGASRCHPLTPTGPNRDT